MGARAALRHSAAVDVFANDPRPQSVAILLALTLWFTQSTLNLIILERPRPILRRRLLTLVRAFLPRSGGRSAIASVPTLASLGLLSPVPGGAGLHQLSQRSQISSALTQHHEHWGLPRCVGKTLAWHYWSKTNQWPLRKGAYGIIEPHPQRPWSTPPW